MLPGTINNGKKKRNIVRTVSGVILGKLQSLSLSLIWTRQSRQKKQKKTKEKTKKKTSTKKKLNT